MVKDGESVGDAFGGEVIALLKKKSGHWKVVIYDIGASDVVYVDWAKKYHAPSSLFGLK